MKCISCGREISDDSEFCQFCGAKQSVQKQSQALPICNEPMPNANHVQFSKEFAMRIQNIDDIIKQAYLYYDQADQITEKDQKMMNFWVSKPSFNGPILLKMLGIILLFECIGILFHTNAGVIFILAIAGCIFGILMAMNKKKKDKILIQELIEKGDQYIRMNLATIRLIPQDYWFPLATEHLAKLSSQGRYDTLKEALNECDEYLHRCKMESTLQTMYLEQHEQLERIENSVNQIF